MTLSPKLPHYWYIVAGSAEVQRKPLARALFGERVVLFRDQDGRPVALLDRCAHRNMALSGGRVVGGCIECPYHGWRYDARGRCTQIPSMATEGPAPPFKSIRAYPTTESDGYVWVSMAQDQPARRPFRFPHLGEPGWTSFRMKTHFTASAFACLENFLDVPHTVFVHKGWFRTRSPRQLSARVRRFSDRVQVEFHDEPQVRSVVSALFFPPDQPLVHTDQFVMPTTSRVDYFFNPRRHFIITSQCTPASEHETDVYTVITFRYGSLGPLIRLVFEPLSRWIIRQDVDILRRQSAQLDYFGGAHFTSVETDLFARHIRALWSRAEQADGDGNSAAEAMLAEVNEEVAIRF